MILFTVLWSRFPLKTVTEFWFWFLVWRCVSDFPSLLTNFLSSLENPSTAFVPQRFLTEFIFMHLIDGLQLHMHKLHIDLE